MSITIYTKIGCPYCIKAIALLEKKGVEFTNIEAYGNPKLVEEMRERANGRSTFPQIFISNTHVGGCDDLYALEEAGKLDSLLSPYKTAG